MCTNAVSHITLSGGEIARLLLPDVDYLRLDRIVIGEHDATIVVTSCQVATCCPRCGQVGRREHSRYTRVPGDVSCGGRRVRLALTVRRLFCDNTACSQRTFVERLPGVVKCFARRTERLAEVQRQLALALGGEAGARCAMKLAMPVRADTLLRLTDHVESIKGTPPRVVGIDDWAWKKGRSYGTILVDLEQQCVIDLLPDRSADTLTAWLQAHPGIEVISRDRGGTYADGARRGAPDAVQVADRWHLLANLREALERLLTRNHVVLPTMMRQETGSQESTAPLTDAIPKAQGNATSTTDRTTSAESDQSDTQPTATEPPAVKLSKEQLRRKHCHERRLSRYEEVVRLHDQGVSKRKIADQVGIDQKTVQRYLRRGGFPEIAQRRRIPSILDRFEPYLRQRWEGGCHNGFKLFREIRTQGYTGSRTLVSLRIARWRQEDARTSGPHLESTPRRSSAERPTRQRRLSPSEAAWLLVKPEANLTTEEQEALSTLQKANAEIETAYTLAQNFVHMVSERTVEALADWIERAATSCIVELSNFAGGLRRDLAAVTAALTLPWSNGQVEGQINRLKLIKRTTGRASFRLLRHRVLAPT